MTFSYRSLSTLSHESIVTPGDFPDSSAQTMMSYSHGSLLLSLPRRTTRSSIVQWTHRSSRSCLVATSSCESRHYFACEACHFLPSRGFPNGENLDFKTTTKVVGEENVRRWITPPLRRRGIASRLLSLGPLRWHAASHRAWCVAPSRPSPVKEEHTLGSLLTVRSGSITAVSANSHVRCASVAF